MSRLSRLITRLARRSHCNSGRSIALPLDAVIHPHLALTLHHPPLNQLKSGSSTTPFLTFLNKLACHPTILFVRS